jgi:hypothetical protein
LVTGHRAPAIIHHTGSRDFGAGKGFEARYIPQSISLVRAVGSNYFEARRGQENQTRNKLNAASPARRTFTPAAEFRKT